jgi:vitamin B12 transporter
VDGVRVKSPTTGQVDLSDLSPDLIERIEIIRGPQSTLYGADAMGGVVNIIALVAGMRQGRERVQPPARRGSLARPDSSRLTDT